MEVLSPRRARWISAALAVAGGGILALLLYLILTTDEELDGGTVLLGLAFCAVLIFIGIRGARIGIIVEPTEISVRNQLRSYRFPPSELVRFEIRAVAQDASRFVSRAKTHMVTTKKTVGVDALYFVLWPGNRLFATVSDQNRIGLDRLAAYLDVPVVDTTRSG